MNYELREKVTAANEIVIGYLQPEYERINNCRAEINDLWFRFQKNKKSIGKITWILVVILFFAVGVLMDNATIFVVMSAVLIILRLVLVNSRKNSTQKRVNELNEDIQAANDRVAELEDTYAAELSILPAEYHFETASRYIVKMVTDDRAETIGQALSQCDDFLHRLKLEQNSDAALREQKMQTEHMRNVERNTFISAMANVATARNTRR